MLLVLRGDRLLLADLVRGDLLLGYLELVRGDLLLADLVRWDMRRREKLVYGRNLYTTFFDSFGWGETNTTQVRKNNRG